MALSKGSVEVLKSVRDNSAGFWFYRRNRGIYRNLAAVGLLKMTRGLFVDRWEITPTGLFELGAEPSPEAPPE